MERPELSWARSPELRGRDAFQLPERAREVTLVGEAASERDIRQRSFRQQLLGALDTQLASEGPDRAQGVPPEAARGVRRMAPGRDGQLRKRRRASEGRFEPLARSPEPRGNDVPARFPPFPGGAPGGVR